jgi:hypothetical protein
MRSVFLAAVLSVACGGGGAADAGDSDGARYCGWNESIEVHCCEQGVYVRESRLGLYCSEFTGYGRAESVPSTYGQICGSSVATVVQGACPRERLVGGCRTAGNGRSLTEWYYAPADLAAITTHCAQAWGDAGAFVPPP